MIDPILALQGDDAFENEFQVVIPVFPGCLNPVGLNLRITKLETPSISYETYKVHYKTEDASKPSGKQTTEKKIKITVRIDKNYTVYKSFLNWARIIHDPATGSASRDFEGGIPVARVPITILYLDANGLPITTPEVYTNCLIADIPGRSYNYETGAPLTMDLEFYYTSLLPMI